MADSKLLELTKEIGTVLATITTANGYSQTVASVAYDDIDTLSENQLDPALYPRIEAKFKEAEFEPADNRTQNAIATFDIVGWLNYQEASEDDIDSSLTSFERIIEFSSDIRKAIYTMYSRQQGGQFTMEEFTHIPQIRNQRFSGRIRNVYNISFEVEFNFVLEYTER